MPPVTSQVNSTRRASFYGRSRVSSSGSNDSSNSSQRRKTNNSSSSSNNTNSSGGSSNSTAATSSKISSSSSSLIQPTKQHSSSASIRIKVDCLVEDSPKKASLLDEEEYQTQVIQHMHHMEGETTACVDLMDAQPELKWFMRPYLVDFIVEIHQTFRLRPETLFLTMNIVDRYVSKRIVYKRHFQLVGCAALLIASKFEDSKDKVPTVSELSQMCCNAYDESAFTQMEGHVLSTISWCLGFPTPEAWLRISTATTAADAKTQSIARFFMEASLFNRDFISIKPSHLAAGSLLLARHIAGQVTPREDDHDVISAAQVIDSYMTEHSSDMSEILVKKYSYTHFASASTLVKEWYAKVAQEKLSQKAAVATGLLPAQSVSAQHLAQHDKATKQAMQQQQQQPSSFSTPRRGQDDEEDVTMRSQCTTPSSMISTPSRMSEIEDEEEEEEDEDEDEDEEEIDMPVTPLSLNSLHDPLVAAGSTSQCDNQKENATVHLHPMKDTTQSKLLQVRPPRSALSISQQDNKMSSVA